MDQFEIISIKAREILDNRGTPTIEVEVWTKGGFLGQVDVPSGRSTGIHEAVELRDGGDRYRGKGVLKAVSHVNELIAPKLKGKNIRQQREIDELLIHLDGTANKSNLGANAIVGVSLAVAKAAAKTLRLPLYQYIGGPGANILPVPLLNLINGGKLAATDLDFQEHIILPVGAKSFSEAIRLGAEVYYELGMILAKEWGKFSLNVADEGGYTPPMKDPREAFDAELKAIEELGYQNKFVLGLDVAASHLYNPQTKMYTLMEKEISREKFMDFYEDLCSTYPLQTIEDPLDQEDFEGFAELTKTLGIQIVGDDLFVTNLKRLQKGIALGSANALLWKVNQIGTLTEALDAAHLAFQNNYGVQVSERSGDTEDPFIADLAVGMNSGQIKTGAPCRSERTSKYNQLLRIEEALGPTARYPGKHFRQPF